MAANLGAGGGGVNNLRGVADLAARLKTHHWAAPVACFDTGGGEDYALVKYVALRRLGFHHRRLRVVWVEDAGTGTHHAVLTASLDRLARCPRAA